MISYTLLIITLNFSKAPGVSQSMAQSSIVIPGFTTEQACINAGERVKIPHIEGLKQHNTFICLPDSV